MMFMQANGILVLVIFQRLKFHAFFSNSGKMEWNERKDILLCHEVLQAEPYRAKEKTVGRAQAWEKIANNLNKRADFKVNKRSVRDHYMVLVEKFIKKTSQELKASGISPEPTELDRLLEEIIERAETCDQSRDEEDDNTRKKKQKEQEQAKDIRLKFMESLSETKKWSLSDGDGENQNKAKKRQSNGTEMVAYLREQATEENRLKERDIEIRSVQLEKEAERQQLLDKQHNSLMELLLQQQQQQQQQFQQQQQQQLLQMQAYIAQQQQQQYKMLMAILEKKNRKKEV